MLAILLAACTPPDGPRGDTDRTPDPTDGGASPTDSAPPTSGVDVLAASCAPDPANALRARCELTLSEPAVAAIELTDGVEVGRFTTAAAAVEHVIPVWGLHAAGPWTFTATAGGAEVTGTLQPGTLPDALAIEVERTGSGPSTLVQVLVPADCGPGGYVVALDAVGRVRWYHDLGGPDVEMAQFTEAGTVLGIVNKEALLEVDLAGAVLLLRDDFGVPVHHDVFRRDDLVYVMAADAWPEDDGNTYVQDLVIALDRTGAEVWRWEERDHLDATLAVGIPGGYWSEHFPGAIDAWHSNGLYVTEEHDLVVSLKKESTLLRVSGADGGITWVLAGDGDGRVFPSDFALLGGAIAEFGNQHHPALLPDGRLTLFDNDHGRGLELLFDEAGRTATYARHWAIGPGCPIQSSVFPLDGGHHLVTCASRHELAEFDAAGVEVGRMALSCPAAPAMALTPRGQPLDLWGGHAAGGVTATRVR